MPPKEAKSPERNQNASSKQPKPRSKSKFKSKYKPEPKSKAISPTTCQPSPPKETSQAKNESADTNNGGHIQSAIYKPIQTQNYSYKHSSSFNNKSHISKPTQPDDLSEANNANENAAINKGKQIAGRWLQNWESLWLWLEDADANAEAGWHTAIQTSKSSLSQH